MMQMMRTTAAVSLAAVMTLGCSQQGAAHQSAVAAPSPTTAVATAEDVMIVDQSRLNDIRDDYEISEPLGEVTASAPCADSAAEDCTRAAHRQLREAAVARGANLIVIVSSALAQSFPTRLSLRGTLHKATPR